MLVAAVLNELGGLATRGVLIDKSSRADVDKALRRGDIVAVARGRYALPQVAGATAVAHGLGGVLSHSVGALHGWEVKFVPELHVTVPRKRRPKARNKRSTRPDAEDITWPPRVATGMWQRCRQRARCRRIAAQARTT